MSAETTTLEVDVTHFASRFAKIGKRHRVTWDSIVRRCAEPTACTSKEKLGLWTFATFAGERRRTKDLEHVCAIGIDYDGGTPFDAAREVWSRFTGAMHTTFSNEEGADCFRVIVLLSRPVSPAEFPAVWRYLRNVARAAGHSIDESTCDAVRGWFLPVRRKGAPYRSQVLGGHLLDPDAIVGGAEAIDTAAPDRRPETAASAPADAAPSDRAGGPHATATSGAESPLLRAFRVDGLVVRDIDGDKVAVRCPWAHLHSEGPRNDTETVIFRGGGFNCFHSHEEGRGPGGLGEILSTLSRDARAVYSVAAQPEPWPEPIPLAPPPPPPFPDKVLPRWVRRWVQAHATAHQVPVEFPALIALAVISLTIIRRVAVAVRTGFVEQVALYVLVVMRSGERKSTVMGHALSPVRAWERAQADAAAPDVREAQDRQKVAEGRMKSLRRKLSTATLTPEDRERFEAERAAALRERNEIVVPRPRRLLADDATPQALEKLLEDDPCLGIFSPEAAPLEIACGRYSETPNTEALCKAFSGDEIRVDRIGREPVRAERPIIAMGVSVQPHVFTSLRDAPALRERGLLARFVYAFPKSMVGYRVVRPPIDEAELTGARAEYAARITALIDAPMPELTEIRVTPEADDLHAQFQWDCEVRLREGGELEQLHGWGERLASLVVRFAAVLHFAACDDPTIALATPIPVERIAEAIELAKWAVAHVKIAFAELALDGAVADARVLVAKIKAEGKASITKRNLFRMVQGRFQRVENMAPGLRVLVERGYVRLRPHESTSEGGRPSDIFDVNPAVLTVVAPGHAANDSVSSVTGIDAGADDTRDDGSDDGSDNAP